MRKAVERFAGLMEKKLTLRDGEHGVSGWLNNYSCNVAFLLNRLQEELSEAKEAYEDCDAVSLSKECVDIANFAMMINDRINERHIK